MYLQYSFSQPITVSTRMYVEYKVLGKTGLIISNELSMLLLNARCHPFKPSSNNIKISMVFDRD